MQDGCDESVEIELCYREESTVVGHNSMTDENRTSVQGLKETFPIPMIFYSHIECNLFHLVLQCKMTLTFNETLNAANKICN